MSVSREEAHTRLLAAGHRYDGDWAPGSERWITPSGREFGLSPELDGTGSYEEEMIKLAETLA